MAYEIAVIPGDGIGRAVTEASVSVAEQVAEAHGVTIGTEWFDWGSDRYLETGLMMPADGLTTLENFDAIFLGAVGHPNVPDNVTLRGLRLKIVKGFFQHVCLRPTRMYAGVESPLRGYESDEIDFLVYRQNTEGEYADIGGREFQGTDREIAVQSAVFTREGTETVVRAAFSAAENRSGHLTSVTKSNAQAYGMVFWDDVVEDVAEEFPDVSVERLLVDAASMDFVRRPNEFDVVVASNLFGDILTDIGAIVSGSIGLAPSANIDPTGTNPSMFEPVHGSAFDIMGEGIANPIGAVRSWGMLFEYLGENSVATAIENLVAEQLADKTAPRTRDIGGSATTTDVAEDLTKRVSRDLT